MLVKMSAVLLRERRWYDANEAFGGTSLERNPMIRANPASSTREIFDKKLSYTEREVMNVVDMMPADKFNFAPIQGAFAHVRTFGVQARHIAFCLNEVAIALLGEKMLEHTDQEGPRNLTSKDDIVRYLKDAFAHAHRAIGTLTNDNLLEQIADPYVEKRHTTRLDAAETFLSHCGPQK